MVVKIPRVSVDILVVKDERVLLGLLTKKWSHKRKRTYGVPGRELRPGEKIGETVKRNIKEGFDSGVTRYIIICVNANYDLGNHYVGIGVEVKSDGKPKVLLPEDWEKWEWFDKDKIPSNLFPAAKNLIGSYLEEKIMVSE